MRTYPLTAVVGCDDRPLAVCAVSSATCEGARPRRKAHREIDDGSASTALLPAVDLHDGDRFSCDPDDPDPVGPDVDRHAGSSTLPQARPMELLHDHLVDLLLGVAATGRSTVGRNRGSVAHAARFVLVGIMIPDDGELRPPLLHRFALAVENTDRNRRAA